MLIDRWRNGDEQAGAEVVERTYRELRHLARAHLRGERVHHTLQPTALLHEAYLRILRNGPGTVASREAFLRLMSSEMRRRLVDHARRRGAEKRGGGTPHEGIDTASVPVEPAPDDTHVRLESLEGALRELGRQFPRAARVVELRFLAQLTTDETAAALGVSSGTVKREWTFARAWLAAALECHESL